MSRESRTFRFVLTFCIMFIFWLLLSWWTIYLIEPFDLTMLLSKGVLASLIVTCLTYEMFVPSRSEKVLLKLRRFLGYIIWELYQIVLATIDVAYRVVGTLPVDPRIIEFDTTLRSDFALVTFANSITLTPGTITINVEPERGRYMVHAIAKEPADSLEVDQTMQKYVGYVFLEE
ncbi:MAG: Na+/H+ antiporter subunit E [Methanotrichaceae archaeon]|nr:Na+/H+ antiporter subunit E [Methanotrichaceae archaeon]